MVREYVKKTSERRREDRHLTIRVERGDPPDLDKLRQLLIRITLQHIGKERARGHGQGGPEVPEGRSVKSAESTVEPRS